MQNYKTKRIRTNRIPKSWNGIHVIFPTGHAPECYHNITHGEISNAMLAYFNIENRLHFTPEEMYLIKAEYGNTIVMMYCIDDKNWKVNHLCFTQKSNVA